MNEPYDLLRRVRQSPLLHPLMLRVILVDEWAWRKVTIWHILVDLESTSPSLCLPCHVPRHLPAGLQLILLLKFLAEIVVHRGY